MSVPTPETTSIIVTESVSTRKVQGMLSVPMLIQSANGRLWAAPPLLHSARPSSTETRKASPEAALATAPMAFSPILPPKAMLMSSPITGRKTIKGTRLNSVSIRYPFRYPLRLLIWSTSMLCLERKIATISARPTATSAAETVITKKTNNCPLKTL